MNDNENAVASMTTGVGLVVTLVVAVAGIVALWKII
jgi:hypothetical protein